MKKINETPVFNGHHGAPCVQYLMPNAYHTQLAQQNAL